MATHRLVIEGKEFKVDVGVRSGNSVEVAVNGRAYIVEITGARSPVAIFPATPAPAPPGSASAAPVAPAQVSGGATAGDVRAPISGLVLSIAVSPGERVSRGSVLLVLEAMKMNNEIFAPVDGIVESVAVRPQQQVAQGDLLAMITPS